MRRSSAQWRSLRKPESVRPKAGGFFSEAELICRRDAEEIEDMWNFISMQQNLNADAAGYLGTDLDKLAERVCMLPQIRAIEEMENGCRHRQVCSIW